MVVCRALRKVVRKNLSLTVVIVAALLVELTMGVMYYSAQSILQTTMQQLVDREMNAIYLCIRNKLAKVEVTMENMAWAEGYDLREPDSLMSATRQILKRNPDFLGVGIPCVPNLFAQKGYWYEPLSTRMVDGTIVTKQVGGPTHDYTKKEFFMAAIAEGGGHWSEPYLDVDGAKVIVTTYSVPIRDGRDSIRAVIGADIALDWLEEVMEETGAYRSTRRFLVTRKSHLLAGEDNAMYQFVLKLLEADDDKEGYETMVDERGEKLHMFYHPVGGKTDWVLISVLNDKEIFGKLRTVRLTLLLLILASLAILVFIVLRTRRNLKRLRKVNAEKDRISGELHVASQIQQSMLPQKEVLDDGCWVMGVLKPAREVGGDLYDYYIRDGKLFFCIGDVSGKGAPSAMVMGVIHSLFRAFSVHENNPAHIMRSINEASCQGNDSNIFVTLFIGVLDLPTGHLRYCDAGHDAPFILNEELRMKNEEILIPSGVSVARNLTPEGMSVARNLTPEGMSMARNATAITVNPHLPVGVFDNVEYGVQEVQIEPGSTIFLYTDGLTEAKNTEHRQFGLERVEAVLAANSQLPPRQLLEVVIQEVHAFVGDAEQSDDLTMLAIRYTTKHFDSRLTETLVLKNDVKEVTKFTAFIKSVTEKLDIEQSLARQLRLAIEEAVVNVIDYAYPAGQEGTVEVRIMSDGKTLKTIIIDSGVAFDPTMKENADTSLSAEDRQIGGLGILLVRELMDSINYERTNNKNILTLTKKYHTL